jgi:hypothetical protein
VLTPRAPGDGFVVFTTAAAASAALAAHSETPVVVSGRTVSLSITTCGEVYGQLMAADRRYRGLDGDHCSVVRLRGLPFTVTYDRIVTDLCGALGLTLAVPGALLYRKPGA